MLVWNDSFPVQPPPSAMRTPQPVKPISVSELRIPPKAAKELQRSRKAYDTGDYLASNDHLEKALRIYPQFFEAHYDLGVNYVCLGQYEQALAQYQAALEIDPSRADAHNGLALALSFLARYPEAETAARRALELDPAPLNYRFLLGRAIIAQGRITPEAMTLLQQSQAKFPAANLIRAQVLLTEGHIDAAAAELQAYLQSADPDNKEQAQCWLALLNGAATGSCAANKTFPAFR
jgi:tetratricopeptide (TPR) repeat protein